MFYRALTNLTGMIQEDLKATTRVLLSFMEDKWVVEVVIRRS